MEFPGRDYIVTSEHRPVVTLLVTVSFARDYRTPAAQPSASVVSGARSFSFLERSR